MVRIDSVDFYRIERVDLAECVALFVNVFNNPPWNESWEAEAVAQRLEDCYQTPGFYGLMAKMGDKAAGFAVGYTERWDKSRHFYLKEMCVAPELQRRGVGAALMSVLEKNLRNEGVEKMYLFTARDSYAQTFYEKQGFSVSSKMIMMAKWL